MIPRRYIEEWKAHAKWPEEAQVEQDMIIERALIHIFSDDYLNQRLAFRGGTAIHKLFIQPQVRYSEDIDLVQLDPEPIKEILGRIQNALSFIGKSNITQTSRSNKVFFRFYSEMPPVIRLRLKIEVNTREHFHVYDLDWKKMVLKSGWYQGESVIVTYELSELLGTKLRALYQRKKGRDLFDLYWAMTRGSVDFDKIVKTYRQYINFTDHMPAKSVYLKNLEDKIKDPQFLRDTDTLLVPGTEYNYMEAYQLVKESIIDIME